MGRLGFITRVRWYDSLTIKRAPALFNISSCASWILSVIERLWWWLHVMGRWPSRRVHHAEVLGRLKSHWNGEPKGFFPVVTGFVNGCRRGGEVGGTGWTRLLLWMIRGRHRHYVVAHRRLFLKGEGTQEIGKIIQGRSCRRWWW